MGKIVIKDKLSDVIISIVRVISIIAVILSIVFFSVNHFVAIAIGVFSIVILFLSKKSVIKITDKCIMFSNKRFLNIFSYSIIYEKNDIVDFEYFNNSINILEFIFPSSVHDTRARIDIIESDGERTKFYIKLSDQELQHIRDFIDDNIVL